nr:MAG: nonstructural protein [Microvirus sp.]
MNTLKIYSIHDQKADGFITPFFLGNDELAKRAFIQCVQDPNHQFCKSPSDFTLFQLGEFEIESANISMNPSPLTLGNGVIYTSLKPDHPQE